MRWTACFLLLAGVILAGCSEGADTSEKDARIADLEQRVAAQSEQIGNLLLEGSGPAEKQPGACPSDIMTFVHSSEGNDCDSYQAHIRGWSVQCVDKCDNAARLAEATASAAATCRKFCTDRKCPASRYMAPAACATANCRKNEDCPAQCPMSDACYLEQQNLRWNCFCDDPEF